MATLMVQGTTSDAGKSTLVAAICRCLHRRGVSVAPFKPQNMALNSAVTEDGGEIGRAQALQAQACRLPPTTDMNPVLLKPNTDIGAQVIIHGKAIGNMNATSYHDYKQTAMSAVLESHQRLSDQYNIVVVEGAGSPAEINLRDKDIANMGFAEAVDCPVIIVADIDRGGVFAHLVGTLALLSPSEQKRVCGFIINRFRGDIALLQSGVDWLEDYTGRPVLGVLPYLHGLHLDAEDAIATRDDSHAGTDLQSNSENDENSAISLLRVVVPVLPRISNHTDFDSLSLHPDIDFRFVSIDDELPPADLIILPGSKSVRDDLAALKSRGWDKKIDRHLRYGGKVFGICGGYQMLGQLINDPSGVEGAAGESVGFKLLQCTTVLEKEKQLRNRQGRLLLLEGDEYSTVKVNQFADSAVQISGYEIHVGVTTGEDCQQPVIAFQNENDSKEWRYDGAVSAMNNVAGAYWHGLFDLPDALASLLGWVGLRTERRVDLNHIRETQLERLADCLEQHLSVDELLAFLNDAPADIARDSDENSNKKSIRNYDAKVLRFGEVIE